MDRNEERIQRALNEQKKKVLAERYGPRFYQGDCCLPPKVEGDWLEYMSEFDRQYSAHQRIAVGDFVGRPDVRPLASIEPAELEAALEQLLGLLLGNNIVVHFGRPVSDAEAYRFITEELLNEEMDNIRIDGMMHTFLYNEYHPDEAGEVRSAVEDFLMAFFTRDRAALWRMVVRTAEPPPAGESHQAEKLMMALDRVFSRIIAFTGHGVGVPACDLDGVVAEARCALSWTGIERHTRLVHGGTGEAVIRLRKNTYGAWDIEAAEMPGLLRDAI